MTEIGILVAFLAGIVSFASPCCLPLVPGYVGYMVATNPDGSAGAAPRRPLPVARLRGRLLGRLHRPLGLGRADRLPLPRLRRPPAPGRRRGPRLHGPPRRRRDQHLRALPRGAPADRPGRASAGASASGTRSAPSYARSALVGVIFAAGWTPCIGPILGGIIGLASVSASVAEGTVLLLVYAIGLGIPFVLVALGATAVSDRLGWFRRHQAAVNCVTGAMLVAIGFLMITNTFARLSGSLPLIEL